MSNSTSSSSISDTADVIVVGSGAAGLTAALAAAVAGKKVMIIEKTGRIGGTSAMSGGMCWIPANHYALAAGLHDSPAEALAYIRAAAPAGWHETEDLLWQAQVESAPKMLSFIERHSPLRFRIASVPDPIMELEGAKALGRLLSPEPLSRRLLGPYGNMIRSSTIPQIMTYHASMAATLYRQPVRGTLRYALTILRRWTNGSVGKGNALIIGLLKGCLDYGCAIKMSSRAVELLTDSTSGAVTGIVVESQGSRQRLNARKGVILATGGFEWDVEMLARHFPGEVDFRSSPRANEGDGHKMAEAVGAAFAHMDQANIMVQPPVPYEGAIHGLPLKIHSHPDAIIVDRNGERFASEYQYHIGERLLELDESGVPKHQPAWLISHWPMVKRTPLIWWYRRYDPTWLVKARTVGELATRIGLPPARLAETVERFNAFAKIGTDLDFRRGSTIYEKQLAATLGLMAPIEQGPFVAIRFKPSLLGTKGGVRTNASGQALRLDGGIIPGLYCAGNVMANPVGTRAPSQIGTTLGPHMTWGYLCAITMLLENR